MQQRVLILHAPVIHTGYLDFLKKNKDRVESIYLIPETLVERFSTIKPDIASIPAKEMQILCDTLGYRNILIFTEDLAEELSSKPLLLVNDHISRYVQQAYFPNSDIKWENVFLRWDIDSIHTEDAVSLPESRESFDREMMKQAYAEAEKSSDWWRHVGAVLVKEGEVLERAHNQGMPSDHTPYQRGAIRDFLNPGTHPELVDTIHAEQAIISRAARSGTPLEGTSLYITHFPCPVCAKLIIESGIKQCFFAEGWSTLASAPLLKAAQVNLTKVVI